MFRALRVLHAVVGFPIFALSVIVQGNDPDPLVWMAIYGAAAVACLLAAAGRRTRAVPAVVGAIAFVWGLTLVPSALEFLRSDHEAVRFTMKTGDPLEEMARECGGLLLVFAWCTGLLLEAVWWRRSGPEQGGPGA